MGQTTRQIEAQIEDTREELGSNLHELERKVKSVTDWKQHFRARPMTMLGVAFSGGVVLATMWGRRKTRRRESFTSVPSGSATRRESGRQKDSALEIWDGIKGALVGVALMRFKDFIANAVPGFHEQFQRAKEEKSRTMQPHPR
jgi:hypothetical protein